MRLITSIVLLAPLSAAATTQLLVPAYFDPAIDSADWNTLTNSVSALVPITAIMNPENGPVASATAAYTSAISSLQSAGGKVIAYVYTEGGSRSITDVEQDIATYKAEYPNINGIFLDEMATTKEEAKSYYQPLYSYIKTENPNWEVVGNPGTDTLPVYLTPTPSADELVTFETFAGYSTYTPPSWEASFNTSSFANIIYDQIGVAAMQTDLSLSVSDRAGSVFVTDETLPNPYASLPSYFTQEVTGVRTLNSSNLKATYTATGSGSFNTAANWSASIPNGVNAEADFLGAITANHTVYSDAAITLGKIVFNNTNSYVLAGAGSLTLQASGVAAIVDAQAGTQKITLPLTIASNADFNADTGATLVIAAPLTINAGQTLSESGSGNVTFLSTITLQSGAALSLVAGATAQSLILAPGSNASVVASAGSTSASQVDSLSLSSNSLLDLHDTDLIVHNGDLATITGEIKSGRGMTEGIDSSAAANDSSHLMTLGVISNNIGGTPIFNSFDGTTVSSSDILIKYTSVGDVNLDGVVNASDYSQINAGFIAGLTGWSNGDLNYDGIINGSDYTLIDNSYDSTSQANSATIVAQSTAEIASAVPEPSIVSWILPATAGLLGRSRRRVT